jgi:hypothetical protein
VISRGIVQLDWPSFGDRFLDGVAAAFRRRRRALAYRTSPGELRLEPGAEGFQVTSTHGARQLGAWFTTVNRASVYVRSVRVRDRGQVLLRLDDLRVVNQPRRIVETYERTIDLLDAADLDGEVGALWREVTLQVL